MRISASVRNTVGGHRATVNTAGVAQDIAVSAKAGGRGSAVSGGEFLLLALATCYCNDVFREAARIGLPVDSVEVEAQADFGAIGLAATNIRYRARVESSASAADVEQLLRLTDAVAEIQNTVRAGVGVLRLPWFEA
jgi:organic hydroperoxide reductase OsmC/OhrA